MKTTFPQLLLKHVGFGQTPPNRAQSEGRVELALVTNLL